MFFKSYIETFYKFSKYVDPKKKELRFIFFLSFLVAILEIFFPVLLVFGAGYLFNDVSTKSILSILEVINPSQIQIFIIVSILLIVFGFIRYAALIFFYKKKYNFAMLHGYEVAVLAEHKFLDLNLASRRKLNNPDIARLVSTETNNVVWLFFVGIIDLIHDTSLILISLGLLAFINYQLFLMMIAFLSFFTLHHFFINNKKNISSLNKKSRVFDDLNYREELSVYTRIIQQGALDTVAQSNSKWLKNKISNIFNKISHIQKKMIMGSLKPRPRIETIIIIILGFSIIFFNLNEVNLSSIYLAGILILLRMIMSIGNLQGALVSLSLGQSNAKNLINILSPILDLKEELSKRDSFIFETNKSSPSIIEMKNLKIGWNQESKILISDLSIKNGKIFIISGPSGSGKTTLLRTLSTSLDPIQGQIKFTNFSKDNIHKEIFYIRQDPHIIPGNLLENLLLDDVDNYCGVNNISLKELRIKSRKILISFGFSRERLESLEKSNSINNEISGGEAQRIAILRIFFSKESKLCLFDEPTASLDKTNILLISNFIKLLSKDKICVVVSHDDYLIDNLKESSNFTINI